MALTLDGAVIREVRLRGELVLDALYAAVRDESWNTVPATRITNTVDRTEDGFSAEITCRCTADAIDFEYQMRITGAKQVLRIDFQGRALTDFEASRIGLCLIHPLELIGTPFRAVTNSGERAGRFPERVSPTSLATGVSYLEYLGIGFEFGGALFEIEDHRNWMDPGWKSYSLDAFDPSPIVVQRGNVVAQTVSIRFDPAGNSGRPMERLRQTPVDVDDEVVGRVPALGLMPHMNADLAILQAIRPHTVHVELVEGQDWQTQLDRIASYALGLGAGLTATLICSAESGFTAMAHRLSGFEKLVRVDVIDASTRVSPAGGPAKVRAILRPTLPSVSVGGGSLTNFAQLNRMPFPRGEWDHVTFAADPQIHHTSDWDVMATVLAQPWCTKTALDIGGGLPVQVAPLALRKRLTPDGPSTVDDPPDGREWNRFGAAWLMATFAAMCGVNWLTLLWDSSAKLQQSPALEALSVLSRLGGLEILRASFDPRQVSVLAVRGHEGDKKVWVTNLTPAELPVLIGGERIRLAAYATSSRP